MKHKTTRRLAIMLATMLVASLLAALPAKAYAANTVAFTEQPQGGTYNIGDNVHLQATVEFYSSDDEPSLFPNSDWDNRYIPDNATVTWYQAQGPAPAAGDTALVAPEMIGTPESYISTYDFIATTPGTYYFYAVVDYMLYVPDFPAVEEADAISPAEAVEQDFQLFSDVAVVVVLDNETDPRDEPTVFSIPIVKVVRQSGDIVPPARLFNFEFGFAEGVEQHVTVTSDGIRTDGVGSYDGFLMFEVEDADALANIMEYGFLIAEVDDGATGWSNSEAIWYVLPRIDEGSGEMYFIICEVLDVDLSVTPPRVTLGDPADVATFVNTYTGRSSIPRTGDMGPAALGLALACSLLGVVAVGASRKRQPGF